MVAHCSSYIYYQGTPVVADLLSNLNTNFRNFIFSSLRFASWICVLLWNVFWSIFFSPKDAWILDHPGLPGFAICLGIVSMSFHVSGLSPRFCHQSAAGPSKYWATWLTVANAFE